jgi:hypothetical protein
MVWQSVALPRCRASRGRDLLPLNKRVLRPSHTYTLTTLDTIYEELYNIGEYK